MAYVIVRRLAFIGDAISHAVFPGIVLAYLAGAEHLRRRDGGGADHRAGDRDGRTRRQDPEDAAIGIFFAAAFALGMVLISTRQTFQGDLTGFLIGNLQACLGGDIAISRAGGGARHHPGAGRAPQGAGAGLLRPHPGLGAGLPVFALDALLLVLLTVTIVVSIQAVGIILVLAMLVTPAATARLLVDRFVPMLALGTPGRRGGRDRLLPLLPPGNRVGRHDRAGGDCRVRGGIRGQPDPWTARAAAAPPSPAWRHVADGGSATGPRVRWLGAK